jgi:hypothetical protein
MHRLFFAKNKPAMDNNPADVPSADTRMYDSNKFFNAMALLCCMVDSKILAFIKNIL